MTTSETGAELDARKPKLPAKLATTEYVPTARPAGNGSDALPNASVVAVPALTALIVNDTVLPDGTAVLDDRFAESVSGCNGNAGFGTRLAVVVVASGSVTTGVMVTLSMP